MLVKNIDIQYTKTYNYKSEIDFTNKNILIYATGWNIDHNVINEIDSLKAKYDILLLKLHPHIKQPKKTLRFFRFYKSHFFL